MKKISGSTFYFKKLFPSIWFGFLGFFVLIVLVSGIGIESIIFLAIPIVMAIFGYVLFKKMVWDLADEVYDEGDSLKFIKGNKEQRIALKDIKNINYTHMASPERIVIQTRVEGSIGKELAFTPPFRFNMFSKSPIVAELIERVDNVRAT